jgi:hypothetical protein
MAHGLGEKGAAGPGRGVGHLGVRLKEGRIFFFEKKKQKTFVPLGGRHGAIREVFLLLFVHKKKSLAYVPTNPRA